MPQGSRSVPWELGKHVGATPATGSLEWRLIQLCLTRSYCRYHGNDHEDGSFFYSADRGREWFGPFSFGDLNDHPELAGMEM